MADYIFFTKGSTEWKTSGGSSGSCSETTALLGDVCSREDFCYFFDKHLKSSGDYLVLDTHYEGVAIEEQNDISGKLWKGKVDLKSMYTSQCSEYDPNNPETSCKGTSSCMKYSHGEPLIAKKKNICTEFPFEFPSGSDNDEKNQQYTTDNVYDTD